MLIYVKIIIYFNFKYKFINNSKILIYNKYNYILKKMNFIVN